MSRLRKQAGFWAGLTYCILSIPLWALATSVASYHDLVFGFSEFQGPPYSPYIRSSLALTEGLSVIALVWVYVFGTLSCLLGTRNGNWHWYLFAGLVDEVIVSGLFTAAYFQSTFLPEPLGKCWNADIWPYNQTYNTSAPTVFEVLAGNATAAEDQCSNLVSIWAQEIVMGVMLSLTSIFAWTMVVRFYFFLPRNDPRRRSDPLGADLWSVLGCVLTPFWWFIQPLVIYIVSRLRYWFRYREKKLQFSGHIERLAVGSFHQDTIALHSLRNRPTVTTGEMDRKSRTVVDRSALENALGCYSPVMDSILAELHYADVLNLKLVSKAVYNAVIAISRETLRRVSCSKGPKSNCWSCRKQICRDCKRDKRLREAATTQHLRDCKLICSECFYRSCCRGKVRTVGLKPRPHSCRGHIFGAPANQTRELCGDCSRLHRDTIRAICARIEGKELVQLSERSTRCGKCEKLISKMGPRWWFCTCCHLECTARYHSAWGRSEEV